MSDEILTFNGIDAETGQYLYEGPPVVEMHKVATDEADEYYEDLKEVVEAKAPNYGAKAGTNYKDLKSAGWGVIYPKTMKPGVKEAIQPLVDFRKRQAEFVRPETNETVRMWKEYVREDEESVRDFLIRNGAASAGQAVPEKMPYYLMIVGGPDEISFAFQYELDVQYGVGRVSFDCPKGYKDYAESVMKAERGEVPRKKKKVGFFGPANRGDRATQASAKHLIEPLVDAVTNRFNNEWEIAVALREKATREKLGKLLGGEETPALLFSASHGAGGKVKNKAAESTQGMLVCQEYPADTKFEELPMEERGKAVRRCCLAADDLDESCDVAGVIAIIFACYGAGTPQRNIFYEADVAGKKLKPDRPEPVEVLTEKPFVSALAKRLLSHPNGGALAMLGHVDRTLDYAFQNPGQPNSSHIQSFEDAVTLLMEGFPVGCVTEGINSKHAELGNRLGGQVDTIRSMTRPSGKVIQDLFQMHDARAFILIGDPAVRLTV